jgi:hypothetical protein
MPPVGLAPRRLARAHAERRLNRGSARWEDDLIGRLRARQSVRRSVRHAPPRPEPGPAQLAKSAATPCNRLPAPPLSQPSLPRVGLARSRLIRRLPRVSAPELLSRALARWGNDAVGRRRALQSVRRSARQSVWRAVLRRQPEPAQFAKCAATLCTRLPHWRLPLWRRPQPSLPGAGLAHSRLTRTHAIGVLSRALARWGNDAAGRRCALQGVRRSARQSVRRAVLRRQPGPAQRAKCAATLCNRLPIWRLPLRCPPRWCLPPPRLAPPCIVCRGARQ